MVEAEAEPYTPKKVTYCGVCSFPPEYCEFGGTTAQCESWLQKNHSDLHARLYSEEALSANMATLSTGQREKAEKDAAKKAAKANAAAERASTARAAAKVTIKRVERNKRKYVTLVTGLEAHGQDLKKIAKELGKKFATGSSVTKRADGQGEEITVQGDVADDIEEWMIDTLGDAVPEDNIEVVEDKKKKS